MPPWLWATTTVGSSLAVKTCRTEATSSGSPGPCAPVGSPVSPQLGRTGASLATPRSASSSPVRCHHHDPSLTHAPCTNTTLTMTPSGLRCEPFPVPLGDDFDGAVGYLDGGLIVNRVRRHRHTGGPFFCVRHGIVRQVLVIQVRKDREIDDAQRFVATGGRLPTDEVVADAGGHHHAPAAQSHPDRLAQRRQEVRQSRLPHPVAQIQGIAARGEQDVSL